MAGQGSKMIGRGLGPHGKQSGKGLKPGLNMADTGSVTDTVRGYVALGRMKVSGNDPKRNSMVSGNTGMRKK